jgi:GntR family transcriptional regulator
MYVPMRLEPGPIPLYYRLQQHLEERIRGGRFRPGSALPSEQQFCNQYGVSRITVRRALDSLLHQGLISRRRGVGTFVADQVEPEKSVRLVGSLDDALSYASELTYKVLSRKTVEPPPVVAKSLGLALEAPALCLEAIGFLKGEPFAYTEFFFPGSIGALIEESDVTDNVPILRIVEQKIGQRVQRAEQTVEPALADRAVARHLGIKPRAPILKVLRTYYTASSQPIETALARYHPERYRYTVELLSQS